jgi:hypothetical protein
MANELLPHHLEHLRASAIGGEVIQARGYHSIESAEARELGFTRAQARPGLLIPLWRVDGEVGGYQLRPDEPRTVKARVVRYETPKGQPNILDVSPTVLEAFHKGRQTIFTTEGAKKADALASLGIPAINIAGVYGWRGKNADNGRTALADWEMVNIKGSIFVLAFDSDILTKREVHQALTRLKRFLEGKGALKVRILILPQLLSGKTGVDDYIHETEATAQDLAKLVVDELPPIPTEKPEVPNGPIPELAPLLDEVATFYSRFVVLMPNQADYLALYTTHTHAISAAETTPYTHIYSAEPESGKTRLGEVAALLVAKPLSTQSISPAALARSIDLGVSLILDEVDTVFKKGNRAASESTEMLRGVLDSGWRRGGQYTRMVGQGTNMVPHSFTTFGPKMLIGIGTLPGTLGSRSVGLELKRRKKDEPIERFRFRKVKPQSDAIRTQLETWALAHTEELRDAEPVIPEELSDRMVDSWEPLLAIADLAGGDWPERARQATRTLSAGGAREDDSIGVRLLGDIRTAFDKAHSDKLFTADIVKYLNDIEESPWGGFGDHGMTGRDLARNIKRYAVSPQQVRIGERTQKGYEKEWFLDAWTRYCPLLRGEGETPETPKLDRVYEPSETIASVNGNVSDNSQIQSIANVSDVSDETGGKENDGMIVGEDGELVGWSA